MASAPAGLTTGDVDGDLNLLTANTANTVSVRLNGGDATGSNTGIFSNGDIYPVDMLVKSAVLADVNSDGNLDQVGSSSTVSLRLSGAMDQAGTFK
ncbi:MAG: hypothetical protein EOO59_19990, partial [Hymenobacter sp.]